MSYTFEEIMSYHPDNKPIYNELKQLLPKLTPFVGAGLTQFAYYSWGNALRELSGKLANKKNRQAVNQLIREKRYLDAAQQLEDMRTPMNLAHDFVDLFSANKLEQKREKLSQEAICLLPHLFPELVLTTNFDETLETVYRESGHPFQTVLTPGREELLRQFIREGGSGLFKLHGTITDRYIEYGKIVFTQAQYDNHYGVHSPLRQELKECFEKRIMLFLGCSLESDQTVDLLQEVIQDGDNYYAIISCKEFERDEKIHMLGKKHIRAILYKQGRHEAVRVILERLLKEAVPDHDPRITISAHFQQPDKAKETQPEHFQTLMEIFRKRLEITFRNSGGYHLEKITAQLYPGLKNNICETLFHAGNTATNATTNTPLLCCLEKDWQESVRSHYMLTGAGGCGKTVAMQNTAQLLLDHGIFTIYIPMHELKYENQSIEKYIQQYILHRDQMLWEILYQICCEGMTGGTPTLVLFLDGWNEVREGKDGQERFIDILREELEYMWMTLPGVQIVLAGRERADKNIGWNSLLSYLEVMPLQKFQIKSYLDTCEIDLPAEEDSVWQTISNPLMLVLYVNTVGQRGQFGNLPGITFISNEKHSSQAAVIWNFLQCQVGKFVCLKTEHSYSYFIAINYAASWIGWSMEQNQQYTLTREELTGLLDEAGESYLRWWSEGIYLTNMRRRLSAVDWQWSTEELMHILCDETSLLYCGTAEEDKDTAAHEIFHFIHQKFRDCYAAIYMRSQLSPYGVEEAPEFCYSWRAFAANTEILDHLDTFFSLKRLDELWSQQKDVIAHDNSFAMFHLLELYQREGKDISRLDFSRQDLRYVSLQNRNLHTDGICFRGARVSSRTLQPQNHTSTISCLTWLHAWGHKSNDYFLSAGRDLRLWNVRTGERERCWQDHDLGITCVAASRDGSRFATTSYDKKLLIYLTTQPDTPSGCYVADKALTAVSFSPAGSLLAVGNKSGKVILCDEEGIYLKDVPSHEIKSDKSVKILCFDDNGRYLSALLADNVLALWEMMPDSEMLLLWHQKITDNVLSINFDRHGVALLYVLETGAVFRLATDTCVSKQLWKVDAVLWKAAVFSQDNQQLAVYRENELKLLHTFNGREYKTPLFPSDVRNAASNFLAFSTDGRKILYGSENRSLFVWNAEQPMIKAEYAEKPLCAIGDSDQRLGDFVQLTENILLFAFGKGDLTWWDIERRQCFRREKLLDVSISHIALSPDKKMLVTEDSNHTLFCWDMETIRRYLPKAELNGWVRELVFSPDGTILCCACDDFHVYGWKMPDFDRLFSIALEKEIRILSLAFLPDGSLLGGSTAGKIYRWKIPEGTELEWPVVHNDFVVALEVSADGRFMISLSQNGFLYYWHLEHLCCLGRWKLDAEACLWHCADISADGRCILAGKVVPSGENELYFGGISLHEDKAEVLKELHIPLSSVGINQTLFWASDSKVLCSTLEGKLYIIDMNQLAMANPMQLLPDIHLVNADFRGAYFEDWELMELVRMSGGRIEDAHCLKK